MIDDGIEPVEVTGRWVGFYRHRWELRPHARRAHWHSIWVGKRDQSDAKSVT